MTAERTPQPPKKIGLHYRCGGIVTYEESLRRGAVIGYRYCCACCAQTPKREVLLESEAEKGVDE